MSDLTNPPQIHKNLTSSKKKDDEDVRPNPTTNLHWSAFAGAIQDIFSRNATSHPDRVCVTETAAQGSPQRVFTYRQISEASNVLAWHLVERGVGR